MIGVSLGTDRPLIGWLLGPKTGKAGVLVVAGHAVCGISLAPGTRKIIAEMVMGIINGKGEG
jgi:hypothetical protein